MTRGWIIATLAFVLGALPLNRANGESAMRHLLNSNVPSTKFDNVPLSDCIDFLHDVSGANIVVDWKTLTAANIARDTPINLRVKNVALRQVLSLILTQAGTTDQALSYYIDRDVIQVTTRAQADKHVYTIVYDVRDLLITVPTFTASTGGGSQGGYGQGGYGQGGYGQNSPGQYGSGQIGYGQGSSSQGNFGMPGGFGTQSPYGSPGGYNPSSNFGSSSPGGFGTGSGQSGGGYNSNNGGGNNNATSSTDAQAQALIKLIETVVQPDAWYDNNGTTAYISEWNGTLIVTAPRSILEAIGGPFD